MGISILEGTGPRATNTHPFVDRRVLAAAVGLLLTAGVSCGEDPAASTGTITRIVVSPAAASLLSIGATQELSALALGPTGPVAASDLSWTSSDVGVISVSGQGARATVTARGTGAAEVRAAASGVEGRATITVTLTPSSVVVTPAAQDVRVGATVQLSARVLDAAGQVIVGVPVSWSSSAPALARVDGSGLVNGMQVGSATIAASAAGVAGTAQIRVLPPAVAFVEVDPDSVGLDIGGQVQLAARTRAADGSLLTGRSVSWTVANPAVATVTATGLVTGVAAGTTSVRATSEGVADSATIIVRPPPPPTDFTDDFERASLANWSVGGRRLGTYRTEVVNRNNSLKAHVYQSTFTEATLFKDLKYGGAFRMSFEMETSLTGGTGTFYSTAGVQVIFLDAGSAVLGWVSYQQATSSVALSACQNSACKVNRLTDSGPTVYDLKASDLLNQIAIDRTAIAYVRVLLWGYGSGWIGGLTAHVWFDDFRYQASGW